MTPTNDRKPTGDDPRDGQEPLNVSFWRRLPFERKIFWKVFGVVVVLVVGSWYLIPKVSSYEITSADYGGSSISALVFSYLVHLWLLPVDGANSDSE